MAAVLAQGTTREEAPLPAVELTRPQMPVPDLKKRYLDHKVRTPEECLAPTNPRYLEWHNKHPDPVETYRKLRPTESAQEQCEAYRTYFAGRDVAAQQSMLRDNFLAEFSPIVVPKDANLEYPPSVRTRDGAAPYVRTEFQWDGERIAHINGRPGRPNERVRYAARIHTNSREGTEPPSIIIERSYPQMSPGYPPSIVRERLLATGGLEEDEREQLLNSCGDFAREFNFDQTSNIWIPEDTFQRASRLRRDPNFAVSARTILEETHHRFWKDKI